MNKLYLENLLKKALGSRLKRLENKNDIREKDLIHCKNLMKEGFKELSEEIKDINNITVNLHPIEEKNQKEKLLKRNKSEDILFVKNVVNTKLDHESKDPLIEKKKNHNNHNIKINKNTKIEDNTDLSGKNNTQDRPKTPNITIRQKKVRKDHGIDNKVENNKNKHDDEDISKSLDKVNQNIHKKKIEGNNIKQQETNNNNSGHKKEDKIDKKGKTKITKDGKNKHVKKPKLIKSKSEININKNNLIEDVKLATEEKEKNKIEKTNETKNKKNNVKDIKKTEEIKDNKYMKNDVEKNKNEKTIKSKDNNNNSIKKREHENIDQDKCKKIDELGMIVLNSKDTLIKNVKLYESTNSKENYLDLILLNENENIKKLLEEYLDMSSLLNLYSTQKSYKPNLQELIKSYRGNFLKVNDLTCENDSTIIDYIDKNIEELKEKYLEYPEKLVEDPYFEPVLSTKNSAELLRNNLNEVFKKPLIEKKCQKQIVLIYKIYFQLIGEEEISNIKNDKEFWTKCCKYVLDNNEEGACTFFIDGSSKFIFAPKNIYKIKKIMGNTNTDELQPRKITNECKTAGSVAFLIKDTFEFCCIIKNDRKNNPNIKLSLLNYYKDIVNKLNNYILLLGNK